MGMKEERGTDSKVRDMSKERERLLVEQKHHFIVPTLLPCTLWDGVVTMAAIAAETEPPPGAGVRAPTLWTNWRRERDASCPST